MAAVFSGILVVQVFSYFKNYPLDLQRVKLLVVVVSFLDACHTTFVAISLWDDLVNHFGDSARADYIPWSLALTIAVTAVLTFLVHCFLVHRIYKLSMANLYITIPLDVIACLRLGSACLTTVKMIELRSLKTFISRYTWSFTLGLALSSLLDILITGLLCYLLMSGRKKNSPLLSFICRFHHALCIRARGSHLCCSHSRYDMLACHAIESYLHGIPLCHCQILCKLPFGNTKHEETPQTTYSISVLFWRTLLLWSRLTTSK